MMKIYNKVEQVKNEPKIRNTILNIKGLIIRSFSHPNS